MLNNATESVSATNNSRSNAASSLFGTRSRIAVEVGTSHPEFTHAREGSRLRRNRHPNGGWNCDLHIPVTDSPSRRQHDLHSPNGQNSASREKAALTSFLSSLHHRLSHFTMYPPANLATGSASDSSPSQPLVPPALASLTEGDAAQPSLPQFVETQEQELDMDTNVQHVRAAAGPSSRNRIRPRATPFCPCFSPTVSDSDTDDDSIAQNARRSWSSSVAEIVRQRLAIVGEAANQLAGSAVTRRSLLNDEQTPTIHRIVEYSHHLVPDIDKILNSSYYWGVMDRFQAEQLLEGKPEGTFLLRDSAQTEYLFSVSFRRYQRTLHARIEQGDHRFSFDIHDQSVFSAPTITQLIEKYKDPARCLFFEPQLTHPLHRGHVFSLQELCRGVIASRITYTGVATLRLPPKLKHYIREYHYTIPVRTVTLPE
ncbi:Suppressor of cytokine signaling 5 [Trichostrongylus colubriformis]|uniref:Suppressor of cytokine signaling 5 n=1 Tax=Trichostrongylus colubriformis TaxID=6319 RepID=A0AAN8IW35_TRICO